MTTAEASALVGCAVKLTAFKGRQGRVIAKLHAVCGEWALVTPKHHKRAEWVPIERVRAWKKGEALTRKGR